MVAAIFAEWLAPGGIATFVRSHLQKAPYAGAAAAKSAVPLFGWETLDRVLGSSLPLDVVVVARGQLVDAPQPRSLRGARSLMSRGASIVVRGAEQHDEGLARLARSFRECLPGEVHVQLYATPTGTHSYGWHYDFEDVFIAQTLGVKDYYFRANTVARDTLLGDRLDFTVFRHETSPLMSSKLLAGDWLYIPARWWHLVKCVDESLSISVGVMPPDALRSARRLPPGWTGDVVVGEADQQT